MHVAAICPVYNTDPADLSACVRSALEQTGGGVDQLLLIDDGSTASPTLAALREFGAVPAVTVIRAPRNAGPAVARNLGLDIATADWTAFLDSDDVWPSDKLQNARATLAQTPAAHWIVDRSAILGSDGQLATHSGESVACADAASLPERSCRPELTRSIILDGLHLGTCLIRRDVIDDRRFDPSVRFGEDILFLAKLSLQTCAWRSDGIGYISRRQRASLMWSAARLTGTFASGPRAGLRDPALGAFRREYRWALYAVFKDMAVNNLINGFRRRALTAALQALRLDPRELRDFVRFLALLRVREKARLSEAARGYCGCEQVWLHADGTLDRVT